MRSLFRSSLSVSLALIVLSIGVGVTLSISERSFSLLHMLGGRTFSELSVKVGAKCFESMKRSSCEMLLSPLKLLPERVRPFDYLYSQAFRIRRSQISRADLPVVNIFISDGSFDQLQSRRDALISEKFALRFTEDNDWVKAKITVDDGKETVKIKAKIRLKGSLRDHYEDPLKWSLRINATKGTMLWGMRKFSVQKPSTRGYFHEPLIDEMMRTVGILAPRFRFVDVRLNNKVMGVMALEEIPAKEMAESQGRREGPFLGIDPQWSQRQRYLTQNQSERADDQIRELAPFPSGEPELSGRSHDPFALKDYPVTTWPEQKYNPKSQISYTYSQGSALLRNLNEGVVTVADVFDYRLLSRWWLINRVWGLDHAFDITDRRYYFNPISRRLEPVSWENTSSGFPEHDGLGEIDHIISVALHDPYFRSVLREEAENLPVLFEQQTYLDKFVATQSEYQKVLLLDPRPWELKELQNLSVTPGDLRRRLYSVTPDDLRRRLNAIKTEVPKLINRYEVSADTDRKPESAIKTGTITPASDHLTDRQKTLVAAISDKSSLYTHLRPFLFPQTSGPAELEIKNLTLESVTLKTMYTSKDPRVNYLPDEYDIRPDNGTDRSHIFRLPVSLSPRQLNQQLYVTYEVKGQEYTRPIIIQHRHRWAEFESTADSLAAIKSLGAIVNFEEKRILFPAGQYTIDRSLWIDATWQIEILAGARIDLVRGSKLRVSGPFSSMGSHENPITISIGADVNRGPFGSWGGLFVDNDGRTTNIQHTHFIGSGKTDLVTRQDSFGITGCVTIYRSILDLRDSTFSNLYCEDSLNLVESQFSMQNVEIKDSGADGLDVDFSNGTIRNLRLSDIGNDGVDFSGSRISINDVHIRRVTDKGISVGEASNVVINGALIEEATSGIVSKDRSSVKAADIQFKELSGTALMAYVKKTEFGPADLNCKRCAFESVLEIANKQNGSRLTIDGKEIAAKPFSKSQLKTLGASAS